MSATSDRPIVVGIDGSPESSHALRVAVREAGRAGCPLLLVNAIHEIVPATPLWPLLTSDTLVDVGHELLAEARAVVEEESRGTVPVRVEVALGPAVHALAAAGEDARMIVLGHRSPGLMERLFTGSTTSGVAARASCPVLSVPREADPSADRHRVVAAVDGLPSSVPVLAEAFATAAQRSSHVEVVHCWRLDPFYSYLVDEWAVQQEWGAHARAAIDVMVAEAAARRPGVPYETRLEYADVADTLVRRSQDADVLVLGRHGHGGAGARVVSTLLGSITRAVLQHARCPVEVVPVPAAPVPTARGDLAGSRRGSSENHQEHDRPPRATATSSPATTTGGRASGGGRP
jgi:nucleotide-binding universal stress UspA family protein